MLTDKSEHKRQQTVTECQWKRTSRSTWCNLSCQKYSLDKTAQHPAQLELECIQHWGMQHFPGEMIPEADGSHYEKFSSRVQLEPPQE